MAAYGYTSGDPTKVDTASVGTVGGPAGPLDTGGLVPAAQIPLAAPAQYPSGVGQYNTVGAGTAPARWDHGHALETANGSAGMQIRGRWGSSGAPATGTWVTGDAVLDSAGVWQVCTAGGTPGTWVSGPSGGAAIAGDLGGTSGSPQVIGTHLSSPLPLAQGGTGGGSASAARTSLGLGGAAVLSVGTSAGTVAAGDDSRITGAAQKSSNLSDLASASTARTNLGLGGAAVLNVGTTTGTVAAGDDSRMTDARTPTAHASTHATGGSDTLTPANIGAATDHGYAPADYGLLAWVGDPGYIAGVIPPSTGILHLLKVKVPTAITVNNIQIQTSGSGVSLTTGQCFAGLYDTSGNRLGVTADQASAWTTNGSHACALTGSVAVPAGYVYVALLFNGTTIPNMGRFATSTQFSNANISGLRFGQYGSGLTSLPSTITMASVAIDATAAFWAGVS